VEGTIEKGAIAQRQMEIEFGSFSILVLWCREEGNLLLSRNNMNVYLVHLMLSARVQTFSKDRFYIALFTNSPEDGKRAAVFAYAITGGPPIFAQIWSFRLVRFVKTSVVLRSVVWMLSRERIKHPSSEGYRPVHVRKQQLLLCRDWEPLPPSLSFCPAR